MQEQVSAERLVSVVRVHADRVHDAVRRLGCSPEAAVRVVEASALDLVRDVAAGQSEDPLGTWFARARALSAQVQDAESSDQGDVPRGEGVLATDADQALLGGALDALPEKQRLALLLRDSYDLPAESVGAALGTDADSAMERVGQARLAFLPGIDGQRAPVLPSHAVDPGALARLGEAGPVAARDATVRRHAQACSACRGVVEAQDYAHRLLTGLVVVALPEADRDALLARVEQTARGALPTAAALAVVEEDEDDEDEFPRRVLTPLGALLGLVVAALLGLGLGLLLVRDPGGISTSAAAGALSRPITAAPAPKVPPPPAEQVQRAKSPPPAETRVFPIAPRTTEPPAPPPPPEPTAVPTTEAPVDELGLTLDPASGPNGQQLTVSGAGWTPGVEVVLTYLDPTGTPTGSSGSVVPDDRGRFTTTLAALDPQNLPGTHQVQASNGSQATSATYEATS